MIESTEHTIIEKPPHDAAPGRVTRTPLRKGMNAKEILREYKGQKLAFKFWPGNQYFIPEHHNGDRTLVGTTHYGDGTYLPGDWWVAPDDDWYLHRETQTETLPCRPPTSPSVFTRERLLAFHKKTCEACQEVMQRKNEDYSGAEHQDPFANFRAAKTLGLHPVVGLMLRMQDKIQRVMSFVSKGELKVTGEGWEDAFDDILNYAILGKAMLTEQAQVGEL